MQTSDFKIITTEDGSHTIHVAKMNETYHSFHGAIQESKHVFIKEGLTYYRNVQSALSLKMLEVGLGTGLNALLTLLQVKPSDLKINYYGLEPFPLDAQITESLNYTEQLPDPDITTKFKLIHQSPWNQEIPIDDNFNLIKIPKRLEDYDEEINFDIIYFDAFAPSKQPSIWEIENLEKLSILLKVGGIVVTYCAKGQVKRDFAKSGLQVETLAGPPGKKEMIRCTKI